MLTSVTASATTKSASIRCTRGRPGFGRTAGGRRHPAGRGRRRPSERCAGLFGALRADRQAIFDFEKALFADSLHVHELLDLLEGSVFLPVVDDPLCGLAPTPGNDSSSAALAVLILTVVAGTTFLPLFSLSSFWAADAAEASASAISPRPNITRFMLPPLTAATGLRDVRREVADGAALRADG